MAALLPLLNLVDASAGIFIKRNIEPVDEFRIFILNKVRSILSIMLAGFGDIISETLHKLKTYHIAMTSCLLVQIIFFLKTFFPLSWKRLSVGQHFQAFLP